MEKSKKPSKPKDLPKLLYAAREGSHLREVLSDFCNYANMQTFRDPLASNWEIPPESAAHWTLDTWEKHTRGRLANAATVGEWPNAQQWDEELLCHAWATRALQAWNRGDVAVRSFVMDLALERLNVWSHGDRRRGAKRESDVPLRMGAVYRAGVSQGSPMPTALELARELRTLEGAQRESVKEHGRSDLQIRVAQAVDDVGASLVGAVAARRLWLKDTFFSCVGRALYALAAAATWQEAQSAIGRGWGAHGAEERWRTARSLVVIVLGNRAKWLPAHPANPPASSVAAAAASDRAGAESDEETAERVAKMRAAAVAGRELPPIVEPARAELVREGWSAAAAAVAVPCAVYHAPGQEPAEAARAARLRGFETDRIEFAKTWAFMTGYSEQEEEEMAPPVRRTKKGQGGK